MWNSEDHCDTRGRTLASKPSMLRDCSHSPPRTLREPTHIPHDFLVHGTPEARDSYSYFSLPVTLVADNDQTTMTASESTSANSQKAGAVPVDVHVLKLWTAFLRTVQDDSDSTGSLIAEPPSHAEYTVMFEVTPKLDVPETSVKSFDEPFMPDAATATSPSSDPLYSRRPPPSRTRSASKRTKITVVFDPSKSIFSNAKASSVPFLQSLLDSPKVDILNKETGEVYIKGVSLDMLKYFCGRAIIDSLLYSNTIRVPPTHASRDGIVRVIRYIRRCCQGPSRRPTGELRTPPSIKEGIATSLACRFFYLDADAEHLEKLVVQDFIGSPRFFVTDEDIELIWCGYEERLRETPFGDAVVWFVLEHVMSRTHALADEVRWLLEQEAYGDLKTRVRCELKKAEWRSMGRKAFLAQCLKDREGKIAANGSESMHEGKESPNGGIVGKDKPLPRPPVTS